MINNSKKTQNVSKGTFFTYDYPINIIPIACWKSHWYFIAIMEEHTPNVNNGKFLS